MIPVSAVDVFAQTPDPAKYVQPEAAESLEIFSHIQSSDLQGETREYINKLFATYTRLRLADPDLLDRLPREFAARVFKMWIAGTLDEWGWPLFPPR